jgi:enamine deaminase RidA (YjgF/YER057c/UK114 family)
VILVHDDESARVFLTGAGTAELYLVASVQPGASAARAAEVIYRVVGAELERRQASIVHERIFGSLSVFAEVSAARRVASAHASRARTPTTYVEGAPCWGAGLAGAIIHAVTNDATQSGVQLLVDRSHPLGRRWRRDGTEYLLLQGITGVADSGAPHGPPEAAFDRVFDRVQTSLQAYGATLNDVVRTWFYLRDILAVYATFNRVRSTRYAAAGLLGPNRGAELLPASTGIGGKGPRGAMVVADVLAVRGPTNAPARRLASHTQLEPMRYGSSFARGAMVSTRGVTVLHVSGTAAIGASGASLYPGDIEAQVEATLDHVASLLLSAAGATLADVGAATAFVKRPEYAKVVESRLRARGLVDFPAVIVVADVCRDELLFELDAEVLVRPGE